MKMIQGVREVFEIVDLEVGQRGAGAGAGAGSGSQGVRVGKMVLIGRGVNELAFSRSLRWQLEEAGVDDKRGAS